MKRYNLYCSEELTYTAAALGAPMEETWDNTMPRIIIDGEYYRIPTIEQICGYLREKEIYISVTTNKAITVTSVTANEEYHNFKDKTYEQAMKKAIDRALYILQKQNKEKNIREEKTKERKEIMSDGRPPFCGNRYDTESEAYNAPWLIKNTIQTTQTVSMIPYYIDPTDPTNESKWDKDKNHPEGMTDEQISKIGFYYNWAATIGVADGEKQTKEFKGKRQGICPNGWHVPSREEYMDLEEYIYEDQNIPKDGTVPYRRGEGGTIASSYTICGTYLKSKTGWHNEGNGLDTYGFNALPAGYIYLSSNIVEIGQRELLWTSTNYYDEEKLAVDRDIDEDTNEFREQGSRKEVGSSVRCIKD